MIWPGIRMFSQVMAAAIAVIVTHQSTVASIDYYGLRSVSEESVRAAVALHVSDPVPSAVERAAIKQRLLGVSGVLGAELSTVCCVDGGMMVYVGIAEDSATILRFNEPPTGSARLPGPILEDGAAFERALVAAVQAGNAGDDWSQGHSLMSDSAARAVQLRFLGHASSHIDLLRNVLRSSPDADHRALAAQILGYAPDKREVIDDLVEASWDADDGVRNNATRALAAIARYANLNLDLGIQIPPDRFIPMLGSLRWSDRNKSAGLMLSLTQNRDPALLARLRAQALDDIVEMARWSGMHATFACVILGRLAGLPEEDLMAGQRDRESRESIVTRALAALQPRRRGSQRSLDHAHHRSFAESLEGGANVWRVSGPSARFTLTVADDAPRRRTCHRCVAGWLESTPPRRRAFPTSRSISRGRRPRGC